MARKEILDMKKVLMMNSNMLNKEQMLVSSIKWLAIMAKVTKSTYGWGQKLT